MRFRVLARKGVPRARGVDVASMSSVAASFPRTGRFAGHGEGDRPNPPIPLSSGWAGLETERVVGRDPTMGKPSVLRSRGLLLVATGLLVAALVGCTGRGGGYLAPVAPIFTGEASFGFSFSCERSSNSVSPNPQAGRLRIQLSYTDHGANPLGSSFSIHGDADRIDPVLESTICIGQNPPPTPNELIFLGTFRASTSAPAGFPTSCPATETAATPLCRFEVIVRDNDLSRGPSKGDSFSIRLSSATVVSSELEPTSLFYVRAGTLAGGNLTVS